MGRYLDDFLTALRLERNCSEHTISAYKRDISEFIVKVREADESFNDWQSVDTDQARRFMMLLHESGTSKRSMQRKRSALSSFYRYLVRHGLVKNNPFLHLYGIKSDKPLPHVLSIPQIDELTKIVPRYWEWASANGLAKTQEGAELAAARDLAMIETIYSAGMRISEAVGINLGDIDFGNGIVKLRGKGKKERFGILGKQAIRALRAYYPFRRQVGGGRKWMIRSF
jgi:integrase/recombinase XerC